MPSTQSFRRPFMHWLKHAWELFTTVALFKKRRGKIGDREGWIKTWNSAQKIANGPFVPPFSLFCTHTITNTTRIRSTFTNTTRMNTIANTTRMDTIANTTRIRSTSARMQNTSTTWIRVQHVQEREQEHTDILTSVHTQTTDQTNARPPPEIISSITVSQRCTFLSLPAIRERTRVAPNISVASHRKEIQAHTHTQTHTRMDTRTGQIVPDQQKNLHTHIMTNCTARPNCTHTLHTEWLERDTLIAHWMTRDTEWLETHTHCTEWRETMNRDT